MKNARNKCEDMLLFNSSELKKLNKVKLSQMNDGLIKVFIVVKGPTAMYTVIIIRGPHYIVFNIYISLNLFRAFL